MKLSSISLLVASLALSSLSVAVAGCAAPSDEEEVPVEATSDELSSTGRRMVGEFAWDANRSGTLVDFQQLTLKRNGTYTASVESGLVDPNVVCVAFPCTLPESGKWNAFKVGRSTRILVRPAGGKPWRYYTAVHTDASLELSRKGETTILFAPGDVATCAATLCMEGTQCIDTPTGAKCEPTCALVDCQPGHQCVDHPTGPVCEPFQPPSCAAMLCAPGTQCIDHPTGGVCEPIPTGCATVRCAAGTQCVEGPNGATCEPVAPAPCVKTGCSGQICADQHMFSTCEWREEYACYQQATCERQANGQCGFTKTPALDACIASK